MLKRILAMVMALALCLSLTVLPAYAEEASQKEDGVNYDAFEEKLIRAVSPYLQLLMSSFTSQSSVDDRMRTLINRRIHSAVCAEFDDEWNIQLSEERYLAELGKFCVVTDELLSMLQKGPGYDPETKTYTVSFAGFAGPKGAPEVYRGYEKVGEYYKVTFRYATGTMELPQEAYDMINALDNPYSFILDGVEYADNLDDIYYRITKELNNGLCFTLALDCDTVKLVSAEYYSDVELTLPENGQVVITNTTAFPKGTKLNVEAVTEGEEYARASRILRSVSGQYRIYSFNATLDEEAVQPNGSLPVQFVVPDEFYHPGKDWDVSVYYLASDGTMEKLEGIVDNDGPYTYLYTSLPHFSTYVLVDNLAEPPATVWGDVNGDEIANYEDALLILRASIGLETLDEATKAEADVNGDGTANYEDALMILRASIGLV